MKTIKTKFFLVFLLSMIIFVALCILMNFLFLEKFYIFENKDLFIQTGKQIKDQFVSNPDDMDVIISSIDRIDGIKAIIANNSLQSTYTTSPRKQNENSTKLSAELENLIINNRDKLTTTYVYAIIGSRDVGNNNVTFVTRLDNQNYLILQKSMKGIEESSQIANTFFIFSGAIIILIGSIFIYFFSKKITKPIIEMSSISEHMADLDFSKRVIIQLDDEIGALGQSINKLSENLDSSIHKLMDDAERKKLLFRNVSHELKTPIGVIKGYAEGLKFGVADDKQKLDKYCTIIASECDRMNRMVKELLGLSSIEQAVSIDSSSFDIYDLIKSISNKLAPVMEEKNIKFDIDSMPGGYITADYELMERAISNYLSNAINHVDEKKYIKLSTFSDDKGIRIVVFNTGQPIPEQDIKNIWDAFYKVDKSRTREYGGSGLGLSIVKAIVEAHKGKYGVRNTENGVEFFLILPYKIK